MGDSAGQPGDGPDGPDGRQGRGAAVLGAAAGVALGAAAGLLGLLPWLRSGARLPLQNLWADDAIPAEAMPVSLLPLSQYYPSLVLALLVVGAALAALLVRVLGPRLGPRPLLAAGAGVLVVHAVAGVQSVRTVQGGLQEGREARLYLAAVAAVVVVSVLAALLVLLTAGARNRPVAVLGLSLAGLLLGGWLAVLVAPVGTVGPDAAVQVAVALGRWAGPVAVGAAVGWGGLATRGRQAAAVGALLLLWVVPAVVTAATAASGSRALLRQPAELVAYAVAVLRAALLQPALALPPLLVAVVVAALVLTVRAASGAGRRDRVVAAAP